MKAKLKYLLFPGFLSFFYLVSFSQPLLSENCEIPAVHDLFDTLHIRGDFDGRTDNTRLLLDGHLFQPLAETRTEAHFLLQEIDVGPHEYQLSDQRVSCSGQLRLIRIHTGISDTRLRRGQQGVISLRVEGLENLDQPLTISIDNQSPRHLGLKGGNYQEWIIHPGDPVSREIPVRGGRPGPFEVLVQVEEKGEGGKSEGRRAKVEGQKAGGGSAKERQEEEACGSVYGKVENKIGAIMRQMVVFVEGECAFCPPHSAQDTLTITNDCYAYEPDWAVVPEGTVIEVKNTAGIDCHIHPHMATKWPDGSGLDTVLARGEKVTFKAKSYWERNGIADDYALVDDFHERVDMSFFVAPNPCFSVVDEEGNYSIGELPPGDYTLKVYTRPRRSHPPSATVTIKAGEKTRRDFVVERDNSKN